VKFKNNICPGLCRCFFFAIIVITVFPAHSSGEDKGVGKNFKNNPSSAMKRYHIKNITPVSAESIEVVIEGEVKDNIALYDKVNSWSDAGFIIRPAQDGQYLDPTPMAPSDDPAIKTLADSLKGANPEETADNIFNFVNKKTDFEFYLNSNKGALGVLKAKKANCCDQSHLVVALLRASGIPARYSHCNPCKFLASGMVVGHVWPEAKIDGKWMIMDTTGGGNEVGTAKNFKPMAKPRYYAKLPF
jgi:transglutaminase-like putative cysteine protease